MKRILLDAGKCLGCRSCENACAAVHSRAGSITGAVLAGEKLHSGVKILRDREGYIYARRCRHCRQSACVNACPAGAMQKDAASGAVWCDLETCAGCFLCVESCPLGAITALEEGYPFKCDLCRERVGGPACVEVCPTGALIFAEVDEAAYEAETEAIIRHGKGVDYHG